MCGNPSKKIDEGDWSMSTGIITVHGSNSPGACLQAHALYKKVDELGAEPIMIDYRPEYFTDITERAAYSSLSAKDRMRMLVLGRRLRLKRNCFQNFENKFYPNKTKTYNSLKELSDDPPVLEAYLCGSDQIWNPEHIHYEDAFFLGFAKDLPGIKASYSSSVGQDVLEEKDRRFLREQIANVDSVSVREDLAESLFRELVTGDKYIGQHIDPTLLYPAEYWRSIEKPVAAKLPSEYFVCFPLQKNPLSEQLIAAVKKKTGLPCVTVSSGMKKIKGTDLQIPVFGPLEFIYLINHAQIVLTNSYHGVIFTLLMERKLVSYRNTIRNSRLESLFRLLELPSPQVDSVEEYLEKDWSGIWEQCKKIHPIIEKEQIRSDEYLRRVLC